MNPEFWERVKEALEEISDAAPEERAGKLEILDEETREEVKRLLALYEDTDDFSGPDIDSPLPGRALIAALIRGQRTFEEGQVLNDRFEIRRFLGSGGMGEVYAAHDRKLGEVAIKTLRLELTVMKETVETFQREVERGRRVAHPNVCRTYEFLEIGDSEETRIPFFTMELLRGRTLSSAILETNGLSESDAFRFAFEICSGLGAAHDAGIVHGDLKAGNVILAEDDQGSVRAKITDFGLAGLAAWEKRPDIEPPSAIAGTRHYLAPELISGSHASIDSDLFALGVLLFHMRTGRYPFPSSGDWATVREQRERPPVLADLAREAGPRWAAAIARCLAPDPEGRPESAAEVVELLRRHEGGTLLTRRNLLFTAGAIAASVTGVEIWRRVTALPLPKGKLRTLVEDLDVASAPPAIGRAVCSLLTLTLDSSKRIRLISAAEILQAKNTFGLGGQPLRGSTSARVAETTKAQVLVSGRVEMDKPLYRIRIWATEPRTKRQLLRAYEIRTSPKNIPGAARKLAELLQQRLGGQDDLSQFGAVPLDQADTGRSEALEAFTLGLAFHHYGEPDAAIEKLAEATRLDPSFSTAYMYHALVLIAVLRDHLALEPAGRAFELRGNVNERHRLYVEYLHHYLQGDWARAHEAVVKLNQFFPEDPNLGRLLSQTYALMQQPAKALEIAAHCAELDPDNPLNANQWISELAETGREDQAERALRARLAKSQESPPILLYCGAYLKLLGLDCARAIEALEELGKQEKLAILARQQIAKARILSGQWTKVRPELERGIEFFDARNEQMMSDIFLYWSGQVAAALEDRETAARQAAALTSRDPIPVNLAAFRRAAELAWLAGRADLLSEIVRRLARVQTIHNSTRCEGIARMAGAMLASARGDYDGALNEIGKSRGLWPDLVSQWVLAEMHCERGRFAEAASQFEGVVRAKASALRFDAVSIWVRSLARMGFCLEALGRKAEASPYLERFTSLWGAPMQYRFYREAAAVMAG